ncbi:MAG: hypothetical protein PHU91_01565, partial [Candidatus Omnitrophica bacterium]|nr:hypothetical protein [Candidatus Omnitrophota bacterium]
PNQKENLKNCTCSYYPCDRKGCCCECVAFHRSVSQVPGCFFPPEKEKTYDRSVTCFVSCFK